MENFYISNSGGPYYFRHDYRIEKIIKDEEEGKFPRLDINFTFVPLSSFCFAILLSHCFSLLPYSPLSLFQFILASPLLFFGSYCVPQS